VPETWTWVHYKVLELAYDQPSLPELCERHRYSGSPAGESVIPATTMDETRAALGDLLAAGAVTLVRSDFVSEGALVRDVELTAEEARALLADDAFWDTDNRDAWMHQVVETDEANALLDARPAHLSPHRPA
jgi:hypothetical protein